MRSTKFAVLACLIALNGVAVPAGAAGESAAAQPGESVAAERFAPDAASFDLANGMQVVVIPDHRTPVVTHMVWYKVGAADEPPGKSGVAHFLEHLMFKGTPSHPDAAFSRIVAERGGQENAFTSQDYTAYYQRVAREHLPLVMELEADRMANLVLSDKDIVAEREVVLEERRSRTDNDPASQLSEEMSAALYRAHPYGRPIIGWEHEIRALNRADAIEFYNTYYTPNNAILIVAGDVTPDEVRKLAAGIYGKVARRAEPGKRVRPTEPPQRAERRITLAHDRVEQASLQRAYDVPGENGAKGEAEALEVLAELLGGGTTSRLYRKLVVEQKIATSVGAYYSGGALDNGSFDLHAVPRGETSLDELETALDAAIADLVENGVSDEELKRAREELLAGAVYAQDSQYLLTRAFGTALTTGRRLEDVQTWPARIASVTADDLVAVARKYLNPSRSVVGILKPAHDEGGKRS
jgi:zinc protease